VIAVRALILVESTSQTTFQLTPAPLCLAPGPFARNPFGHTVRFAPRLGPAFPHPRRKKTAADKLMACVASGLPRNRFAEPAARN